VELFREVRVALPWNASLIGSSSDRRPPLRIHWTIYRPRPFRKRLFPMSAQIPACPKGVVAAGVLTNSCDMRGYCWVRPVAGKYDSAAARVGCVTGVVRKGFWLRQTSSSSPNNSTPNEVINIILQQTISISGSSR
jgi:hypothetical protein